MKLLENIRIIDFIQGYTGSYATMLLADHGAEVIKIEPYGQGDVTRGYFPHKEKGSAYNAYINRGKKSICVNMDSKQGREIIIKLIKTADVVCENYPAGTLEKYGLDYEKAKEIKPDIIYASLTGFGKSGAMSNSAGCDLTSQALSGLMGITGFPDSKPTAHGTRIADQYGSIYLAYGIMLALLSKNSSGEGQKVDISCTDCLFTALESGEIKAALSGEDFKREGNNSYSIAPYDTFQTSDGYFSTGVSTDTQWENFCNAMGLEYLLHDEKFSTNELRGKHYTSELRGILRRRFSELTKFECDALLSPLNIPAGPLLTVSEALENEQLLSRDMIVEIDDSDTGKTKMPANPIKMSLNPQGYTRAPKLGEHTFDYLKEIGIGQETIEKLIEEKVLGPDKEV